VREILAQESRDGGTKYLIQEGKHEVRDIHNEWLAEAGDTQVTLPALNGVRVLDLTRALSGPFSTMILADMGADVIKVEPMPNGDFIRGWGPFDRGVSTYFLTTNRNKRSICLDFRHPEGLALLREWAMHSDILVENFKPNTMAGMKLDYESLVERNPKLIYASISGFGSSGPMGALPGFDQIAQAYSGLMSVTGTAESGPIRVGVAIGDLTAGMWTAIGVLGALRSRDQTGHGQKLETSLLASLVSLLSVQGQRYLSLNEVPEPTGNDHPVIAPYGVFMASDGQFNLAPATPEMWIRLCKILGLGELLSDDRFIDNAARVKHRGKLKVLIEKVLLQQTRSHWIDKMIGDGIPAGPIHTIADVLNDPQIRHCKMVEAVEHPTLGSIDLLAGPIKMASLRTRESTAPPLLGQHTVEILESFGTPGDRIAQLLHDRVVLQAS
jgi:crotonobetainyl-CoA:carnitine CoA-transferase CaiB-like acyl-CoA transferase